MKIYTRGGDKGKTSVIGGQRRFKNDPRVEAYGSVDEAGAFIGLASSFLNAARDGDIAAVLAEVSQALWDVGADLAAPADEAGRYVYRTTDDAATTLEPLIDRFRNEAEQVKHFIMRGGSQPAASLHVACTVVRRAERRAVAVLEREEIHLPALKFLNRLSDLLFVLARTVNARDLQTDVPYIHSPEVF